MHICKDLGIDDPVTWWNAVPSELVDLWIAFMIVEDPETKEMKSPKDAFSVLKKRFESHGK